MLKAVFFDLDGTLLRFDENKFLKMYFQLLCEKTAKIGYEPKKLIDTIWKGTALMYHNNGEKTNEVVFWEAFQEESQESSITRRRRRLRASRDAKSPRRVREYGRRARRRRI